MTQIHASNGKLSEKVLSLLRISFSFW